MADFRRLLDSDTDESDFSEFDSSSSDESSLSGDEDHNQEWTSNYSQLRVCFINDFHE